MKKSSAFLFALWAILAACAPGAGIPSATPTSDSLLVPGRAMEYVLHESLLEDDCVADGLGIELPNQRVLDLREDGQAYLEITQRKDGWLLQYNCENNPSFLASVVVVYGGLDGPGLALSQELHQEIWGLIDSGDLEHLPNMPGLGEEQIVFRNTAGTIGVEFTYRNLYLFLTGSAAEGEDNYEFFNELAAAQLARVKSMVP